MEKTVLTRLRNNHLAQEAIINTTAVPALVYFIFICFPFAQKSASLFLSLVALAAIMAFSFGFCYRFFSSTYIREVMLSDKKDVISQNSLIKAKQQAFKLPFMAALSYLFRWTIIGNLVAVLPFVFLQKVSFSNYMYISLFLFFAGLSAMPYAFFSTEYAVSGFLRFQEIGEVDMKNQKVWKLPLTPKILTLILTILIPPLGFILTAISLCLSNNIELTSIQFGFFLVTLQALFFSILTGILFARNIKTAIDEVVSFLTEITQREGDLTRTIRSASNDEVGELANGFNEFIQNLRSMIMSIIKNAKSLDTSSDELSKYSQQMFKGADDMSKQSNTVATSAEAMSSNISIVAASMEEATTNVNIVASATEEMTASINEIAQNSEKARLVAGDAVTYAQNASGQVDELEKAAQDISKITEVISEISEQTNLLALNATIEAARAGDAGRSFAVVASEIKELAKQTADATNEIKNKIEGIQQSTSGTISEIGKISKIINDVNDIVEGIASAVEEQAVTTMEIAGNIAQASAGNEEVNKNVAQSSQVSINIAEDITAVYKSANEISSDSSEINQSAEKLSDLAELLMKMVDRFKI